MNGKKSTAGNSVLSVFTGNTGIIGVLVILCVVVALATDKFLTPSNIISVLRQISINTYIALGMTLIIILGHIDLAVGAIVAMSGTLTVGFVVNQGLPIGVAIAAGIIIGVVAGLIDGMVVSKFRVPAFIITMAMMNVCNGIAYVYSGGQSTRITDKFFIAIGTGYLFNIIPLPVVYMIILIIVFSFLLSKTKFGTYVYAIGGTVRRRVSLVFRSRKLRSSCLHCRAPWRRLQVWFWHRECIPDSRPSEVAMRWMRSQPVSSAEPRWQADADVSAAQYSVRW